VITDTCQRWTEHRESRRPAGETIQTSAYEVAPIPSQTARAFVEAHHYSGTWYGLQGEGHVEATRARVRAEDAGWYDEELYDSAAEARAHRLAGYSDDGNAKVGKLAQANIQVAGHLALNFGSTTILHYHATT